MGAKRSVAGGREGDSPGVKSFETNGWGEGEEEQCFNDLKITLLPPIC